MGKKKLIKAYCEIIGCNVHDPDLLHLHHIIERTEEGSSNDNCNLAIICANHHELVHSGKLKIIGVVSATKTPNNRILIYELEGKRNIDIDISYIVNKPKSQKIVRK